MEIDPRPGSAEEYLERGRRQCHATTARGERCRNGTQPGYRFCPARGGPRFVDTPRGKAWSRLHEQAPRF
jgi:hypothetical protein